MADALSDQSASVLRAYGLFNLTRAEQRARAGVLHRMGAFGASERTVLIAAGLLAGLASDEEQT